MKKLDSPVELPADSPIASILERSESQESRRQPVGRKKLAVPSSLYRSEFWMLGIAIVRLIPRPICVGVARFFAELYWMLGRRRREIVIQNFLPAVNNDRALATEKAHELFRQFARKIIDLWRYEAGLPIENSFGTARGWEIFEKALAQKRGVLLLTPHLGNWEFGGPWLTKKGVRLLVVTLAEPGQKFTQMRQASRARWNIETVVIGDDGFAFVEIIKQLEAGATVALLVDRPTPATEVTVELFGKPFPASIAAAELARASGCVLLPVFIPREGNTYGAYVLPPIEYDRTGLRDREARIRLTQEIFRAFESPIRQHLDEWYHFIPIWK
jgi:lauroyl/myristoyl acyltransferase